MSQAEKECFYKHMGHAKTINRDNYQCPAGFEEISVMGRILGNLYAGNYKTVLLVCNIISRIQML